MIRSRRTTKCCNICDREVAVLKTFRFETVFDYITLRVDNRSFFHNTDRDDAHICYRCWERMQDVVRRNLEREENSNG